MVLKTLDIRQQRTITTERWETDDLSSTIILAKVFREVSGHGIRRGNSSKAQGLSELRRWGTKSGNTKAATIHWTVYGRGESYTEKELW